MGRGGDTAVSLSPLETREREEISDETRFLRRLPSRESRLIVSHILFIVLECCDIYTLFFNICFIDWPKMIVPSGPRDPLRKIE